MDNRVMKNTPYISNKKACFRTHPELKIIKNSISYYVSGGNSIIESNIPDCDIFVGLDFNSTPLSGFHPWDEKQFIYYPIINMKPPSDKVSFMKLIVYLIDRIEQGKKVHIGCIGGHGRTGLVFSILVNKMMGIDDSTTYVRNNYCAKAVESQEQINWLYSNFNIAKVKPREYPRFKKFKI